jgi:hypothetical protein
MKKAITLALVLMMCLSLLPMTALAAVLPATVDAPLNPKATLDDNVPEYYLDFTDEVIISLGVSPKLQTLLEAKRNGGDEYSNLTYIVQVDWSINSPSDWKCSGENTWSIPDEYGKVAAENCDFSEVINVSMFRSNYQRPAEGGYASICYGIDDVGNGHLNLKDNTIYLRARYWLRDTNEGDVYSPWTPVFTLGKEVDDAVTKPPVTSDWAKPEIEKADALGLIPESLQGADLTKPITRAEFAAVSVKAYEALSNGKAIPAVNNPFTDCNDVEVLKAYNVGITGGTSATTFDPDTLLNREQAATMLTRVFKKVSLAGWTLATDGDFTLSYTKPAPFADDNDISDFAKDSVYFMAANGIITGTGNNMFSPKAVTDAQKAQGYAQATREQALIIAVRMVENLKK